MCHYVRRTRGDPEQALWLPVPSGATARAFDEMPWCTSASSFTAPTFAAELG